MPPIALAKFDLEWLKEAIIAPAFRNSWRPRFETPSPFYGSSPTRIALCRWSSANIDRVYYLGKRTIRFNSRAACKRFLKASGVSSAQSRYWIEFDRRDFLWVWSARGSTPDYFNRHLTGFYYPGFLAIAPGWLKPVAAVDGRYRLLVPSSLSIVEVMERARAAGRPTTASAAIEYYRNLGVILGQR
jgi:hypothetical protein